VEPYLGLGAALARAGHRVRVTAPAAFQARVRQAGLDAFPVEPDPRLVSDGAGPPRWLESSALAGATRWVRGARAGSALGIAFSGYLEASRGADVVLHPPWLSPVARTIAEICGCHPLPAYLAPLHPTRSFPSPFMDFAGPPRWNYVTHLLALRTARAALRGVPNAWRSQVAGLAPAAIDFLPPNGEVCLYGFSHSLQPPPPDWPPGTLVTGPWWLEVGDDWRPPEAVVRFLQAPGKVVYLGFGSMLDVQPRKLNGVIEAALTRLGCRAIVLVGPGGLLDLPSSDRLLAVRDIPLDWLFRRVDAVVHHGGAGTTAQAARSGKPTFAVPFFADQRFWGDRLHRAGGGPCPIPRRAVSPQRLAEAIDAALNDPVIAERAANLGTRVRAEAGLSTAVRAIEGRFLGG